MTVKPLKYFGLNILASNGGGGVPEEECREALGAFLLTHSGYPTDGEVNELSPDETFEFIYKGRVWRFSFILVRDVREKKTVPFRIDFDYIREANTS